MAKSFDELANRTMSKDARRRGRERAQEMMASMFIRQMRESLKVSSRSDGRGIGRDREIPEGKGKSGGRVAPQQI